MSLGCSTRAKDSSSPRRADVLVIGSGFGGLGAAVEAVAQGRDVVLLERLSYPGGCGGTFTRRGLLFPCGATVIGGFDDGQLFAQWTSTLGLTLPTAEPGAVLIEHRGPAGNVAIGTTRAALRAALCESVRRDQRRALERFLALQECVADAFWPVLDKPGRLPPFDVAGLSYWTRNGRALARVLPWLSRSLGALLRHFGLDDAPLLRSVLNGLCQITLHCSVDECEAAFGLVALDFPLRGVRHLKGGSGALADAVVQALRERGAAVHFSTMATGIVPCVGGWRVETRSGAFEAPVVIANLLPRAVRKLLPAHIRRHDVLDALDARVRGGYGAAALYLQVDAARLPRGAPHLDLIDDSGGLRGGHHVFLSQGDSGQAVVPVSVTTHFDVGALRGLSPAAQGRTVDAVQAQMRKTLERRAPEWWAAVVATETASPRTWARFVGRPDGYVGGAPRRTGSAAYAMNRSEIAPGLALVGDTIFPGQSVLATALGGQRVARQLLKGWRSRRDRAFLPPPNVHTSLQTPAHRETAPTPAAARTTPSAASDADSSQA